MIKVTNVFLSFLFQVKMHGLNLLAKAMRVNSQVSNPTFHQSGF